MPDPVFKLYLFNQITIASNNDVKTPIMQRKKQKKKGYKGQQGQPRSFLNYHYYYYLSNLLHHTKKSKQRKTIIVHSAKKNEKVTKQYT